MGRKQASLSLRLSLETVPPEVILLQEPGKKPVKIKDYRMVGGNKYFTTLVHRTFAPTERDLDGGGVECGYIRVPVKKGDRGIHIVNVHGNPKLQKVDYRILLRNAVREAGKEPLVMPYGRKLFEGINQERLTLLTEPDQPTRMGTSTCRDSYPDLTLVRNMGSADWENLAEQLGSDHRVLETTLREAGYKRRIGTAKITDWDNWRKAGGKAEVDLVNIEEWAAEVTNSLRPFVKKVKLSEKTPSVDARLLYLWEARRSLTKRWKRQRHNKKIRTKIEELTKLG